MSRLTSRLVFPVCFCLLGFLTASAQSQWSLIGKSPGSLVWYLDRNFIKRGSGTAAWEKLVFPDGSSIVALNEWNCATRKKRLLQSDDYNPAGLTIRHQGTPLPWRYVVPDSIEETTFNIVCGDSASSKKNRAGGGQAKASSAFAAVTKKSALKNDADPNSEIIRKVAVGEKLVLLDKESVGVWYRVLDPKTNSEGWLNGNHFRIVKASKTSGKRKPVRKRRRN